MNGGNLLEYVAGLCKKSLADEWEVAIIERETLAIEAKEGKVDSFETARSLGVAVRVRVKSQPGFSYSSDTSKEALKRMLDSAIAGAKSADPQPEGGFAEKVSGTLPPASYDEEFDSRTESEKIERARKLESNALAYDRRIARVRNARYGEGKGRFILANSNGLQLDAVASGCSASLSVVAEENGQAQYGWAYGYSANWAQLNIEKIAQEAAEDAVSMLGAHPIPTTKSVVIIRNSAVCDLLGVLGNSFLGESVAKGKSMLANKLGEKVFSELINIYDDHLLEGGRATFPFDGEGTPSQRTELVSKGVLTNYLFDILWGNKVGKKSTGNAMRGSFTSPPLMGLSNLYIEAGKVSLDELLKDTGRCFLVKELMGVHLANPVSGDFSLGATGAWLENGTLLHPVQGVTIAGNIVELFASVDGVASDLKFVGNIGAPSLRVPSMTISGK